MCVCLLGLPPDFKSAFRTPFRGPRTSAMCTVLHAIVAAALPLLAGSSAPAARQETGPRRGPLLAWLCRVGAGWGRPIGAERSQMPFLERSRLVCSHRARPRSPRPGASKPDRSDGHQWAPHLIDGQERNSQTRACIVYHVHLSLRHRHRRAFPPRRFVSPGSAPVHAWASWRAWSSGDRAGLVRSVGRAWDAPLSRGLSHRSRGVQISAQLSGWSLH